jgi:cystathionine beta-synthase/cysteine synthase
MKNSNIVEAMQLPRIIQLKDNLYAIAFDLMKLLPAHYIIDCAIRENLINKDTVIIETSSGTFALGLAMICNLYSLKLIIVSDPVIDENLKRRLEDLGAQVEIVMHEDPVRGFQGTRLDKIHELLAFYPNSYWTKQYDNPRNTDSYALVAELLIKDIGKIDTIIGSVGSGGSMSGTSKYLKQMYEDLYVIGVDTNGSTLFGQKNTKRELRGLGNSLIPKNLNHELFNEVHWLEASQAYKETRELHQKYSIFMGGTSGAAYSVAKWYNNLNPNKTTVVLLPDQGYRYQETIYNDVWLKENNLWIESVSTEPKLVKSPEEAQSYNGWSRFLWNNMSYKDLKKGELNE